jgi:glucan phosphoethanolaminetransferase (alkaline phosphatase superfamily)
MSKFKSTLILASIMLLGFIAPDFLAKIFTSSNQAALSGKFIGALCMLAIFLSMTPRIVIYLVISFLAVIELIQFGHLFYYNSLITSTKFRLLFSEFDEILLMTGEALTFMYIVPFLVLLPYGIIIFATIILDSKRFKTKWAIIPVVLFFAFIPYRVNKVYHGANYYPDPTDHSLRNSLYTVTNSLYNLIYPQKVSGTDYLSYDIEPINTDLKDTNVILIIGESANYSHMSLFGYKRDTNPLLSSLKTDPNFVYLKGYSGAVSTPVSLPMLMNNIYEPNNMKALEEKKANLFKLAKQHNFKTFYISAQSGALLTNLGAEFIDYTMFRGKDPLMFNQYQDEALLKIIPDLDYGERNFIVINQRSAHAPYEENYQHNPEFNHFAVDRNNYQQFRIDTYDNAMRYNDFIIYKILEFYKQKFAGPTYIFFTSDHGEVLDSNKVAFGHADLKEEVAEIPFLAYSHNSSNLDLKDLREPVAHYELGCLIAKIMGFKINNPNKKDNAFYIHGTDLSGHNEFIEYHK